MAEYAVPLVDYNGKLSTARLPVDDAIIDGSLTALLAGVALMTIGAIGQTELELYTPKDAGPGGAAAAKTAQIELKWLVKYHDLTVPTDEYTMEIPCADASLLATNTENMDIEAGNGATFATEFEATVKAPKTGNAVQIDEVLLVGRNL